MEKQESGFHYLVCSELFCSLDVPFTNDPSPLSRKTPIPTFRRMKNFSYPKIGSCPIFRVILDDVRLAPQQSDGFRGRAAGAIRRCDRAGRDEPVALRLGGGRIHCPVRRHSERGHHGNGLRRALRRRKDTSPHDSGERAVAVPCGNPDDADDLVRSFPAADSNGSRAEVQRSPAIIGVFGSAGPMFLTLFFLPAALLFYYKIEHKFEK